MDWPGRDCLPCLKGHHWLCTGAVGWCGCSDERCLPKGTTMTWRLARALTKLRDEVNAAHPDRPKQSDGTIGDAAHAASISDHNPVAPHPGVVTAWDITAAPFCDALAETLRTMGKAGDGRVKYVIWEGRIVSAREDWAWRPYSGASQHFDHIHLSLSDDPREYDRMDPWNVFATPKDDSGFLAFYTRPLVRGDRGAEVRRIRHRLGLAGDVFDDELNSIVRHIQHRQGWRVNGRIAAREARRIYTLGGDA